jgi:sporulation protein YlmC with PRC-barrel domain
MQRRMGRRSGFALICFGVAAVLRPRLDLEFPAGGVCIRPARLHSATRSRDRRTEKLLRRSSSKRRLGAKTSWRKIMLKTSLGLALAATALSSGIALAQTNPPSSAGAPPAMSGPASGQFLTQLQPNMMRGSKLMGVDVYGSDNQKIGDIDEVIVDRDGRIQAVVVGVGGFLGIGTKDVAFAFSELQWMADDQARTAANTAGGVTAPASPSTGQPATTGSTGMAAPPAGTTTAAATDDDGVPDRAMVRMTKADLQNAPEFRYRASDARAGSTNPPASTTAPPAGATRPATPQ